MFFNIGSDEYADHYRLGGCYIFLTKTLIMLGNPVMPSKSSNRIAFATVLIGGIVLYYYWEAMLISYLAVRKIELPLRTLEDLQKSNFKVDFCMRNTGGLNQNRLYKIPYYLKQVKFYIKHLLLGGSATRYIITGSVHECKKSSVCKNWRRKSKTIPR